MVFLMSWLRPARAFLGFKQFLDGTKGSGNESDLAEEVGFEDSEGDDAEEQGNESGQLQLDESEDGEELLQLLLLLATACKNK